jgi:palmitoyltransferase
MPGNVPITSWHSLFRGKWGYKKLVIEWRSNGNVLNAAALNGQITAMEWLLEHGSAAISLGHVNAKNENGNTALHGAADNGHVAAMEWLADHGVDIKAIDSMGNTAVHCAAATGHVSALKWMAWGR